MWGYDTYESKGEWTLVSYWGKIAKTLSKLQKKEKKFLDRWTCLDYVREKIDNKLSKGYVRVENRIYSQYSSGEITLAELVEKIEENT